MTPLIKPIALVGGTLLLLLLGHKAEAATLPPVEPPIPPPTPPAPGPFVPPPAPKPPAPPPPGAQIPLGSENSFPAGTILGVVTNDGINLRQNPTETSAPLGRMSRGTLLELFEDGHSGPTPAAPQGWERVRTANGILGFIAAQFLTAEGVPGGPRETPGDGGGVEPTPGIQEQEIEINGMGRASNRWFSPMVGAGPAYGQTRFVAPRQHASFSGMRSINFQLARALRLARPLSAAQVHEQARLAAAQGYPQIAGALYRLYLRKLQPQRPLRTRFFAPSMRG